MEKTKQIKHKWIIWAMIIWLFFAWGGVGFMGYDSLTNPAEYTKVCPEGYWLIGVVVGWFSVIVFWISTEFIREITVKRRGQ